MVFLKRFSAARLGVGALLLVGLACALAGCDSTPERMRIATNLWVGYQPLFLARERGFIDGDVYRLIEFGTNRESLRAFRNGEVEVAALTLDEVMRLRADGLDARVVLVLDDSQGADALVAAPSVNSLAELKNKRIAVEPGAVGAYMLSRMLQKASLSIGDVSIVRLDAPAHVEALAANQVDAVITYEPMRSQALAQGARELFSSRDIPGEIVDVLAVRGDVLGRQGAALAGLAEGWFSALDAYRALPAESAGTMAPRIGLDGAAFVAAMSNLHFPDRQENCRMLSGEAAALYPVAANLASVMRDNGLLKRPANLNQLLDSRVIEALGCEA